jgi:hypothetical protein
MHLREHHMSAHGRPGTRRRVQFGVVTLMTTRDDDGWHVPMRLWGRFVLPMPRYWPVLCTFRPPTQSPEPVKTSPRIRPHQIEARSPRDHLHARPLFAID